MKDFSIIIPTYERQKIFEKALNAAHSAIEGVDAEIIIVNDSKKKAVKLPITSDKIVLLNNPGQGVASARNFGAAHAKSNFFIFLDDDIIISESAIQQIRKDLNLYKNNCYLFNWLYPPELVEKLEQTKFGRYLTKYQFTTLQGWVGAAWKEDEEVFELPNGASYCLPITKENFYRIGGYNESFPHAGAEDYEFSQRAMQTGIKFYLNKKITVYHNEEDRLDMQNWMARKRRNGETIRLAYELGYNELRFRYSPLKKTAYLILSRLKPILYLGFDIVPNHKMFDLISFRFIHLLLGTHLFEGYNRYKPNSK